MYKKHIFKKNYIIKGELLYIYTLILTFNDSLSLQINIVIF